MHFTSFITLALATVAIAAPNKCNTEWHTTTVTTTSGSCPIVSLPLSPIVTGTLVPVTSILGDITTLLKARAPEPTAMEARGDSGDCRVTSWKTATTTVKPTCAIVNPTAI